MNYVIYTIKGAKTLIRFQCQEEKFVVCHVDDLYINKRMYRRVTK
jgi:hypothetical protein